MRLAGIASPPDTSLLNRHVCEDAAEENVMVDGES